MTEKISKKIAECEAKVYSRWMRISTKEIFQQILEILDEMNKTLEKIKKNS